MLPQDLLSRAFQPGSEYLTLTPRHYGPYVELLLRANVAEKHPGNAGMIRLVPFHK